MAEYIKKLTMRKCCIDEDGQTDEPIIKKLNEVIDFINSIDVAPVRHGKWTTTSGEVFPGSSQFLCYSHKHEECGFQYVNMDENEYDYCPNCGAKMDLEDNHDSD